MWDPRNLMNLDGYLRLAIPSMLFIILEWSIFDVTTIIAGFMGILEQDVQIILMNVTV
jgi:hypothetical protein